MFWLTYILTRYLTSKGLWCVALHLEFPVRISEDDTQRQVAENG